MMKVISRNKDAFFNYHLIDKYDAGIQLFGWEVKSIRKGNVNIKSSFCSFKNNELFVSNIHINNYMNSSGDETRPRKLLLNKKELKKIKESIKVKRYTIIPTILKWSSKGYIKIEIALSKGKTKFDKREIIKKRDIDREMKKTIKNMGM